MAHPDRPGGPDSNLITTGVWGPFPAIRVDRSRATAADPPLPGYDPHEPLPLGLQIGELPWGSPHPRYGADT
jgi:hypothetical protein